MSAIVDVIRPARACRAVGTLIAPEWPSAFFWPLLKPRPSRFASFVVDVGRLPRRSDLIIPGPGQKIFIAASPRFSLVFGCPKFSMLALRIDFRLASWARLFLFIRLFLNLTSIDLLVLLSICLRFTEWPVCSMCLLRLPGGMVYVSGCTIASCIPRVGT